MGCCVPLRRNQSQPITSKSKSKHVTSTPIRTPLLLDSFVEGGGVTVGCGVVAFSIAAANAGVGVSGVVVAAVSTDPSVLSPPPPFWVDSVGSVLDVPPVGFLVTGTAVMAVVIEVRPIEVVVLVVVVDSVVVVVFLVTVIVVTVVVGFVFVVTVVVVVGGMQAFS